MAMLGERQHHRKMFESSISFLSQWLTTYLKHYLKGSDSVTSIHLVVVQSVLQALQLRLQYLQRVNGRTEPRSAWNLSEQSRNRVWDFSTSLLKVHHHGWPGLREVCLQYQTGMLLRIVCFFLDLHKFFEDDETQHQYRTVSVKEPGSKIYT